ncbi:MAG: hypothetical protein K6F92_00695 [Lachnospiraceae bacterium]|nr:hypothetical protein [Lachnospiraceae bacterium]
MFFWTSKRKRYLQTIRDAVETYPGGLLFAHEDGRAILVNRRMNELFNELVGHTIMNARIAWQELEKARRDYPMSFNIDYLRIGEQYKEAIYFEMDDKHIWRFSWKVINIEKDSFLQGVADDVTEQYRLGEKLYQNTLRTRELHVRQKKLLKEITKVNLDKELLQAKMRVHDKFGGCVLATKQALFEEESRADIEELFEAWEGAIRSLSASGSENSDNSKLSSEQRQELIQSAELIGCKLVFEGGDPVEPRTMQIYYAAIREALTNAVRHADADVLKVRVTRDKLWYKVTIASNGNPPQGEITLGGGLSNLKKRIEGEGGFMDVEYAPQVVISFKLKRTDNV